MANPFRGEIAAQLGANQFTLCLTLSALAELESRLGVASITELLERFQGSAIRAGDMLMLLLCALKGHNPHLSEDEAHDHLRQAKPATLIKLAGDLLQASFSEEEAKGPFDAHHLQGS